MAPHMTDQEIHFPGAVGAVHALEWRHALSALLSRLLHRLCAICSVVALRNRFVPAVSLVRGGVPVDDRAGRRYRVIGLGFFHSLPSTTFVGGFPFPLVLKIVNVGICAGRFGCSSWKKKKRNIRQSKNPVMVKSINRSNCSTVSRLRLGMHILAFYRTFFMERPLCGCKNRWKKGWKSQPFKTWENNLGLLSERFPECS